MPRIQALPNLASTATLIRRIREGDRNAHDLLAERCLPLLRRWARGRLPSYGRDLSETDDVVQLAMLRGLRRADQFSAERPGAFLAYLRQILVNVVRNEIRDSSKSALKDRLETEPVDSIAPSQEEVATHRETLRAYEAALDQLPDEHRTAVVLRVEFGMTFAEIAAELDIASANAARMRVTRALERLAATMSPGKGVTLA